MPPRPPQSRRMTLGGDSASIARTNRRSMSAERSGKAAIAASGVKPIRPPTGRKSMIPRVGGRENAPPSAKKLAPPVPSTPRAGGTLPTSSDSRVLSSPGVLAPTAASSRRSMGGAAIARRQSIGPSVAKFPTDPRPITEKTFQLKASKTLMTFLKETNYPHAVTHRSLGQPSSREFNQILTFMLRLTDPNFQVDSNMKFEDEVCLQFKCLGYPFTISKTSLAAAGSPHTWPTLLAALCWLAEHLTILRSDEADDYLFGDKPFESLDELETNTVKAFYQYLLLSYQSFMQGDSARINELELALQKRFDEDDKLLENEVERVEDLNATIIERTNMLRQDAGNLPEWQQKRDDYLVDLEQFQDLNRKMDDHKKSLQQKKQDLANELCDANDKLLRMAGHIDDLKHAIKTQKLSPSDLAMLEAESKGAMDALHSQQAVKIEREKELLEHEDVLNKQALVSAAIMNKLNCKLRDVRSSDDFTEAFRLYTFALNEDYFLDADPKRAFGVTCKDDLQRAIIDAVLHVDTKAVAVRGEIQDALDRLAETVSAKDDVLSIQQILLDKIAKSKESLNSEQKAHQKRLEVRERETDALSLKVEARRDPMGVEEQVAVMERELALLEALRQKHTDESIQKKNAAVKEIESACELMTEFENFLEVKLTQVEEYRGEKMSKAAIIIPPTRLPIGMPSDKSMCD
ncbi:hypothetical protein MPSEU_000441200 [Mayamaea pseudoterrestris]|nr:hypothetical protein MPSEU_000441200 [Mayamaea pseudoterrestris]